MNEVKIKSNLVFHKDTNDLIGYVDLGDPDINYASFDEDHQNDLATYVLVFMVRGVSTNLTFSLAYFSTKATATQIFPIFWNAVNILECSCNLKVIAVTSDGACSNRNFFKMHQKLQHLVKGLLMEMKLFINASIYMQERDTSTSFLMRHIF